jgi:hypothetical protein
MFRIGDIVYQKKDAVYYSDNGKPLLHSKASHYHPMKVTGYDVDSFQMVYIVEWIKTIRNVPIIFNGTFFEYEIENISDARKRKIHDLTDL